VITQSGARAGTRNSGAVGTLDDSFFIYAHTPIADIILHSSK